MEDLWRPIGDPIFKEKYGRDARQMQRLCLVGVKVGKRYYKVPAQKIGKGWVVNLVKFEKFLNDPITGGICN